MTSVKDLDVLEYFPYSAQGFGHHSFATVPVNKVQELICMIKNPFYYAHANLQCWAARLGSRGLAILELKTEKGEKLPLRDLRKLNN